MPAVKVNPMSRPGIRVRSGTKCLIGADASCRKGVLFLYPRAACLFFLSPQRELYSSKRFISFHLYQYLPLSALAAPPVLYSHHFSQYLSHAVMENQIAGTIPSRFILVNHHKRITGKIVNKAGGRIDHQTGASNDEHICRLYGIHGIFHGIHIKRLLVEYHIRFHNTPAVRAVRHRAAEGKKTVHIVGAAALGAVIFQNRPMKLHHILTACLLVKAVNILGNNTMEFSFFLQPGQSIMSPLLRSSCSW